MGNFGDFSREFMEFKNRYREICGQFFGVNLRGKFRGNLKNLRLNFCVKFTRNAVIARRF